MKKFLSILLTMVMVLSLAACGSKPVDPAPKPDEGNDGSYTTTVVDSAVVEKFINEAASANLPDASADAKVNILLSGASLLAMNEAEELFKYMAESLSGGSITVDWHPYNELGGDYDVVTNTAIGDIGMGIASPAPLTSLMSDLSAFDSMYLINDTETAYSLMDGDLGKAVEAQAEAKGLKVCMWAENGFRNLTCQKEVKSLEDLKGMKIRTMENDMQMAAWKALGANPTPMAFGEVFTALQQGTIEGQENPIGLIYNNSFMDVCDYLVLSEHNYTPLMMFVNLELYNGLTDAQRAVFDYCCNVATQYERSRNGELADQYLADFQAKNVNVVELDDATKASFKQAIEDAGVYQQIQSKMEHPELLDALIKG